MTSLRRKFVLGSTILLISLVLIEVELHALAAISSGVYRLLISPGALAIVPNETLGWRPNPRHPEHDAYGFRNESVPEKVDFLALGDSQVYGVGVRPDQAWPRKLGSLHGCITYNMGFGGYGPVHSLLLLEEALSRNPETIVQAVYSGNDFLDSYWLVYEHHQLPRFRNSDETTLGRIEEAERQEPMNELIHVHFGAGSPRQASLQSRLADRFRVLGLVRAIRNAAQGSVHYSPSEQNRSDLADPKSRATRQPTSIDKNGVRTVFTPARRGIALNPNDPRILEGHRISLEVLREMRLRTEAAGSRFVVLLIPTKEFVFRRWLKDNEARVNDAYWRLVADEEQFWHRTKQSLTEGGFVYVDAEPALRGCLENGNPPYPQSDSGHPNSVGHEAIAKAMMAFCLESSSHALKGSTQP